MAVCTINCDVIGPLNHKLRLLPVHLCRSPATGSAAAATPAGGKRGINTGRPPRKHHQPGGDSSRLHLRFESVARCGVPDTSRRTRHRAPNRRVQGPVGLLPRLPTPNARQLRMTTGFIASRGAI